MKKLTPIEIEYNRLRANALRRISYARKKGYDISESVIPKKPKRITEASLSRLQKITFSSLTKKSAPKKSAPKKSAPKKSAPKKSAPKKSAPKKSAPKKSAPKKSAPKKSAPKKSAPKKSTTKKSTTRPSKKQQKRSTKNAKTASAKYGENTGANVSGMILDRIFSRIVGWSPALNWNTSLSKIKSNDRSLLRNILNGLVSNLGAENVEKNLQANAEEVNKLVDEILFHYSGGKDFDSGRQLVQFDIARFIAIASGKTPSREQSQILDEYMSMKDDSIIDSGFGDMIDEDDFLASLII